MRLNLETHSHHSDVDAPWLELTAHWVSRGQYIAQLTRVFGFEAPLEGALAYTPNLSSIIDLRRHARSGLIAQDLLTLDLSPAELTALPQCTMVAPFATATEALGWLYAMERATLLHELVHRHLVGKVPSIADACSYISAYDNGVAADRWGELGQAIELVATSQSIVDDMAQAAIAAFDCAELWYRPLQLQFMSSR